MGKKKLVPLKIVEIQQTCSACPSQWSGYLDNGFEVYVRYRWGGLSIRVPGVSGSEIFYKELGDPLDGCLSYKELKKVTKDIIEWPKECTND